MSTLKDGDVGNLAHGVVRSLTVCRTLRRVAALFTVSALFVQLHVKLKMVSTVLPRKPPTTFERASGPQVYLKGPILKWFSKVASGFVSESYVDFVFASSPQEWLSPLTGTCFPCRDV